ncbi:MAG: c-type cytochrome [Gallionellaceae bacterium]|nr:c-type cytochrome [Gallionellaceae bacterium]
MKATLIVAAALLAVSGSALADEALAKKKACMSCHQVAKKVVGPSLKDVANKYKGDAKAEAHLVSVIQNGGKGVWGNVPMPKQPMVKPDEAATLAKWVLSL